MLYICSTPIGNLKDITLRALEILAKSDIILCEDTRVSKVLLRTYDIKYNKLVAFHEHNEAKVTDMVIKWLKDGMTVVQISDAGTPGISDPGARLCKMVFAEGLEVSPLPGACAYISLLSVAGIDCSSLFYGFLPSTKSKRVKTLMQWADCEYAVGVYESPHRVVSCIEDIVECLGEDRVIIMGRELTKQFETIKKCTASQLLQFIKNDNNQQKGEFVLIITPKELVEENYILEEHIKTLNILSEYLPPKKAARATSLIHGGDKNKLYEHLLKNK